MKIALFALGVFALAQGIHLEDDSSMVVEYDFEEDEPTAGCVVDCDRTEIRNFCQGFAEIRSEFNGVETVHGKMIKDEGEATPMKASKLRYKAPGIPGGRDATKIIEVQGNCCWKFYKR